MSGFMAFQDLTFLGPKLQITTTNLTLRKYLTIALHFVFTLPEPYFLKKELIFQVRPSKLNYIFLELPILFDMSAKQVFSYRAIFHVWWDLFFLAFIGRRLHCLLGCKVPEVGTVLDSLRLRRAAPDR